MTPQNGWRTATFGELIAEGLLVIGDGYRAKLEELGGDGPIFLRAGHVTDTHIDFEGVERFEASLAARVAGKMSRPGDVVVTTKGNSTGRVAYVGDEYPPFVYSPHLSFWRSCDPEQLYPGFLRYWSRGREFQDQLTGLKASTDMAPYLSLVDQRRLRITLPPPGEQQSIAAILGALDARIELNRRMNATLEAMARALFKSWFVDFDPVRAKAEGRLPAGTYPEMAALFPDAFEASEIGDVPRGWQLAALPDAIEVNPHRPLPRGASAPYLDMQNMPTRGHRPNAWINRPFGSGTKFVNGDTLLARITPCLENGKTAFVDFLQEDQVGWGSTEYIIIRPKPPLPVEYGYYLARSDELRSFAIQNMTGSSGRQRVPADCFRQFRIVVPPGQVAESFGHIVRPLMPAIRSNAEQSDTLASIRDALLPKLLSGEIRVKEAERVAEAAL